MRPSGGIIGWLPLLLLTACVASQIERPTAGQPSSLTPQPVRPALDRLLTRGDIQVARTHLKEFGFDPGPIDGIYTAQTQAAVRAFHARYGSVVSGELDYATRRQLLPGLDFQDAAR
jgi:peptidoglycan hydrolase-like protein with peptidoglycan-binding domain